jgi:hypothetical protein
MSPSNNFQDSCTLDIAESTTILIKAFEESNKATTSTTPI